MVQVLKFCAAGDGTFCGFVQFCATCPPWQTRSEGLSGEPDQNCHENDHDLRREFRPFETKVDVYLAGVRRSMGDKAIENVH
jgi:hypothetical protein